MDSVPHDLRYALAQDVDPKRTAPLPPTENLHGQRSAERETPSQPREASCDIADAAEQLTAAGRVRKRTGYNTSTRARDFVSHTEHGNFYGLGFRV